MNISYDWYKVFCCVADCGSITLAAEKLYISQPAVSQSIRQLEDAVGCALFQRTPKGVKLTAEGQVLYRDVSEGVRAFSEGERRLLSMLRLDAGEIKIGASDMTLEFCLLPYLERFHAQYPNVKIAITNHPTPQTLELLKQGKIDFAAVSEPFTCADFDWTPMRKIHDIFICGCKTKFPSSIPIQALREQLILLEHDTSTRAFLDSEFCKRGFTASPKFELATSPQIVSFAARNMGIGCVVSDFARKALAEGTVFEIQVSDPLPPRRIGVVRHAEQSSKAANAFLHLLLQRKTETA